MHARIVALTKTARATGRLGALRFIIDSLERRNGTPRTRTRSMKFR
jgi:hypothetical protein